MHRTLVPVVLASVLLPGAVLAEGAPPIIAVFDVEVRGVQLPAAVVDELGDFVAARLTESGLYHVVPRDRLRERLVQEKKASYRSCYEQSCQIELGREMAAQKTLATRIARLGGDCTVNLTVYDLAKAASEKASIVSGPCTEAGIVASLKGALDRLGARPGAPPSSPSPGDRPEPQPGPAAVVPAPEVEEGAPRVKRSAVTAPEAELVVQARTASGTPVRLELTDPAGRTVVSASPFKDPRARIGTWKVRARATGHEASEQSVQVVPDDVTLLKIELKPLGALRITTDPPGATVRVTGPDGFRDEGGSPWEAEGLRTGSYRVEASRDGYAPASRDVEVPSGSVATVDLRLAKEAERTAGTAYRGGGTSVSGTTWAGPESDGDFMEYQFLPDGTLRYTSPSGTWTTATWRQTGDEIYMNFNNKYAERTGRITGTHMKGKGHNVAGKSWTWEADRK